MTRPAATAAPAALAGPALALTLALAPHAARADGLDVQVTSRLAIGGGVEIPVQRELAALFELGARLDLLVGDDRPARVRLGPGLDLRTAGFSTFEGALGLSLVLPLGMDFVLGGSILAGAAARLPGPEGPRDGAIGVVTLRAGYQPYDHFDAYSMGLHLYVSGRWGFFAEETWEATAGVEIDLELVFVTPVRFAVLALSGGDPDEPDEHAPAGPGETGGEPPPEAATPAAEAAP